MESLLRKLSLYVALSESLIAELNRIAVKRNFPPKVRILSPTQDQQSLIFLTEGITRNYYRSGTKEWTSCFSETGDFVLSVDSFLLNLPCKEFIETCTAIEFIEIPKKYYNLLLVQYPETHSVTESILVNKLNLTISQMHSWQMKSIAERYHMFTQQFPNINKKVQLKHVASYLGVTPFHLSRIRRS